MNYIDMRSDTVSLPTDEMLETIKYAELGDDVLGDDQTVQKLEELGARIFGKEAALLTASGTMSNQIAVMVYTERGQEVILGKESHIYNLEVAALSTLSQVQVRAITCPRGYIDPIHLENEIQSAGLQTAQTGLVCLENTYNLNKGYVLEPSTIASVRSICDKYDIPIYLDGARIFNAATALGMKVSDLVMDVDAVQVCLTKGLSAPIGSLLIGSNEFIKKARRIRQRLGGGMRQAGIIAAPAILALEEMPIQLQKDHYNAKALAKGIERIDKCLLDPDEVTTNIVSIDVNALKIDGDKFLRQIFKNKIKIKKTGQGQFRLVTHRQITHEHIEIVLKTFRNVLNKKDELV